MNDPQRTSPQVTLEDLLRLKRAERPPAGFWVEFEQNLRAKQLAAIVEKRPRWYSLRSLLRWTVPIGAAGAVAATVVSFSLRSAPSAIVQAPSSRVAHEPAVADASAHSAVSETGLQSIPVAQVAAVETHAVAQAEEPSVAPVPVETEPTVVAAATHGQLASVAEQIAGVAVASDEAKADAPSFVSVADGSAPSTPGFGAFFERAFAQLDEGFRPAKQPAVEPLTQVQSPRDARRARLLAYSSSVDSHSPQYSNASNVIRSRDRITSHLNEEALYDSIRRLGVMGNGVSIQF